MKFYFVREILNRRLMKVHVGYKQETSSLQELELYKCTCAEVQDVSTLGQDLDGC